LSSEAVWLSLARAYEYGNARLAGFLRTQGLTARQYNILRILRGAGDAGLSCSAIAERMISRDPDITRLADRLEKRGLALRRRGIDDRREVVIALSREGRTLTDAIDAPLKVFLDELVGSLTASEAKMLVELLRKFRGGHD
jgi:DNA-binding MarR family transcriptional regulator